MGLYVDGRSIIVIGRSKAINASICEWMVGQGVFDISVLDSGELKNGAVHGCEKERIIVLDLSTADKQVDFLLKMVRGCFPRSVLIAVHHFQSSRVEEKVLKEGADYYVPFGEMETKLDKILKLPS